MQKVHVDDEKDNVPTTKSGKAAAKAEAAATAAAAAAAGEPGPDGIERQQATVSGIMSSSEFSSLELTENVQKVWGWCGDWCWGGVGRVWGSMTHTACLMTALADGMGVMGGSV